MDRLIRLVREAHRRSLWQVLAVYVFTSWAVLGIVDTLTGVWGLPEWVPPFAFVLLLIGLPVVMATAVVQEGAFGPRAEHPGGATPAGSDGPPARKGTSGADSGAPSVGAAVLLQRHLTWRRAILGGVGAFSLLGTLVAAYFLAWSLGIGPVGSLVAAGEIEEGDWIVVADFEAPTDDPDLGAVVSDALRIDLSEHPTVRVADESQIRQALDRMQAGDEGPLTPELAREVALREGMAGILEGEVARVGTGFALSATLRSAESGEGLARLRESAQGPDALIPAIERLSARLRERAGEPLRSVRAGPELERVTTASLDALRLFSRANRAEHRGDLERAIPLFEEAVELDPDFGIAWRRLGVVRLNRGETQAGREALRRAYELRENLSERERYHVESTYYQWIHHDWNRAAEAFERILELDPDDGTALNNYALLLGTILEHQRAVELLERAVALPGSGALILSNLSISQTAIGDLDAARATVERLAEQYPDHPQELPTRAHVLFHEGNIEGAHAVAEDALEEGGLPWWLRTSLHETRALLSFWEGRLGEAREHYAAAARSAEAAGEPSRWWSTRLWEALGEAMTGDPERGARIVLGAQRDGTVEALPPGAREHFDQARVLALTGHVEIADSVLEAFTEEISPEERGPWDELAVDLGRAYVLIRRGEPEEAIHLVEEFRSVSGCATCDSWAMGWALREAGRLARAAEEWELAATPAASGPGRWYVLSHPWIVQRLGPLYEELGEHERALHYYRRLVELWGEADPELEPRVEHARERIAALEAEAAP